MLVSAKRIYAFLGGTLADAFELRPNDVVRHAQVILGVEEGKEELVLGGGYAPNDGIFRHKKNLAPRGEVPFRVACLVHDADAYASLMRQRAEDGVQQPEPGREKFFPAYRG